VSEGGFFFEITLNDDDRNISRVQFQKFVNNNIYPIADYTRENKRFIEEIIDPDRYKALKLQENFDMKTEKYSHIPEIELFLDIRNFFRRFQTKESETRIQELEIVLEQITNEHAEIAFDIVGSLNMGLSSESSDIDLIIYLRIENVNTGECLDEESYKNTIKLLDQHLKGRYSYQLIDCINLNVVEKSVKDENYECEITQRFVTHRAMCRPVNYRVIAPIEDLLNTKIEFRKEVEGSVRSYFKIFMTTTSHSTSFDKYLTRIKSLGVKIPDAINAKIKRYLDGG
jgi:hypothetical protein